MDRNGVRIGTENGGQKRGADRNGELQIETEYGEKRRITVKPETVVKDGSVDGVGGVRNGVDWKGRNLIEGDGKAWNVTEGPERVPE